MKVVANTQPNLQATLLQSFIFSTVQQPNEFDPRHKLENNFYPRLNRICQKYKKCKFEVHECVQVLFKKFYT